MVSLTRHRNHNAHISLLLFACLSGCDGVGEEIYNCNPFPVNFGEKHDGNFEGKSFYITFAGGKQADGDTYIYPDGSVHRAKVISGSAAWAVESEIREPGNAPQVRAICKKFGPGIVLVK